MTVRNYWLDLFTGTTWQEFLDAGAEVSGFRERRWKTVQRMKPGDYLLCYLTGVSRWIGVFEVTSDSFQDDSPIWKTAAFPCRVRVKEVVSLTPETAVPVYELRDQLSMFQDLTHPNAWTGWFRGSPRKFRSSDGEVIVNAVMEAKRNPIVRPVDPAKLSRRPQALRAKRIGPVTVPESEEAGRETVEVVSEPTSHEKIQWMLLKLGSDMGLDVWVARNDQSRVVEGHRFADLPNMRKTLPRQFDEVTQRIVELIDVLWLRGSEIIAAFEVESTTSIYSGLLRMSDLIAMQPNLKIPLYLVAPDERRGKVITEVNRPTFSRLSPPMSQVCRFISFSTLEDRVVEVASVIRYLRPQFLDDLSESCEPEDV